MSNQHEYRVVVCDKFGNPTGEIHDARPTSVTWDLNGIGSATFTFPVLDDAPNSGAALLPAASFPAVNEVMIFRDGQIIWWGLPISAAADRVNVTVQCSGLLWYLAQSNFGPQATGISADGVAQYLLNRQFEAGLTSWGNTGLTTVSVDTRGDLNAVVLVDFKAARLHQDTGNVDSYLFQTVTVDTADGFVMSLTGWYYVDPDGTPLPINPAAQNRGLYMELRNDSGDLINVQFAPIAANTPVGQWMRLETDVGVPAGSFGWTVQVRLYCIEGYTLWDDVSLIAPQSVGSTSSGGDDVTDIIKNVLDYANSPSAGKWRMNVTYDSSSDDTGVVLIREYLFSDNTGILDALNEFPGIGACDFEVVFPPNPAANFPGRQLHVYAPAKGTFKPQNAIWLSASNFTDLAVNVDGSKVRTAQRVIGQGGAGTARELAYAAFPSYLRGKVSTGARVSAGPGPGPGSTITTTAPFFVAADFGDAIYGMTPTGLSEGVFPPGTIVTQVVSSTVAVVSQPAFYYGAGATIGVGGILLDDVSSAPVNQPAGIVATTPLRRLATYGKPLTIPVPKLAASAIIGQIFVGDVIPVYINYGWAQVPGTSMRIASMTLLPPTDEVTLQLNEIALT